MAKQKPLVSLKIDSYDDRVKVIHALADNGYLVTIKKKDVGVMGTDIYIVVWSSPPDEDAKEAGDAQN
jgi:hypothetical protein